MSITSPPVFTAPGHGDPIATLFGNNRISNLLAAKVANRPDVWMGITEEIENIADAILDLTDDYLSDTPEELFDLTSVYTGNTRGALKLVGKYPHTEIEFDIKEWMRPKVLTNLTVKVVHSEWKTKHDGWHSKDYVYAPGRLRVKITGKDYAPRIPMPPHGGGNVYMLKEVFETLRDDAFNRIAKRKGF